MEYLARFKATPLGSRKEEAALVTSRYPDRVPVVLDRVSRDAPTITKNKYLVPRDLTVARFVHTVRPRIPLNADQTLYVFVESKGLIARCSTTIGDLYACHKSEDGFLYLLYALENVFGLAGPVR